MSDIQQNTPMTGLTLNMGQVIDSRINARFIVDIGIIIAVNGDLVDVQHAIIPELTNGKIMPPTITHDVEIMSTASNSLSIDFNVKVGDVVLLVGTKDYVESVQGLTVAMRANSYAHYTQANLKALPFGSPTAPLVQIAVDNSGNFSIDAQAGKIKIKNTVSSLYTVINDLTTAIDTFSNATAQSAITSAGSAPLPAPLAGAIVVLMGVLNTSILAVATELSLLLEA